MDPMGLKEWVEDAGEVHLAKKSPDIITGKKYNALFFMSAAFC